MKLFTVIFLLTFLIFNLFGCSDNSTLTENQNSMIDESKGEEIQQSDIPDDYAEDVVFETRSVSKEITYDGSVYYSISDDLGYDFEIRRKTDENYFQTLITDTDLIGEQLIDWEICDDKIFFTSNMWLYCYDMTDESVTLLNDDVSNFDLYNGYIYFSEHASRTFTVYRTKIGSDNKEVVIGNDIYDENNPKELVSNFVVKSNGDIVFTQRVPYGLYVYHDGNTNLLLDTDDIYEYSLCCDLDNVYYVLKRDETSVLCCYTSTGELREVAELMDFSRLVSVENGVYSYRSSSGEIFTGK